MRFKLGTNDFNFYFHILTLISAQKHGYNLAFSCTRISELGNFSLALQKVLLKARVLFIYPCSTYTSLLKEIAAASTCRSLLQLSYTKSFSSILGAAAFGWLQPVVRGLPLDPLIVFTVIFMMFMQNICCPQYASTLSYCGN